MMRSFWVKSLTMACSLLLAMSAVAGSAQTSPISIDATQPAQHQVKRTNTALSILYIHTDGNATDASIAVDQAGGLHVAASPMGAATDGTYPAYYAYCASACTSPVNWTILELEDIGVWGGYVRMTLDSNGHPRMVWVRELTEFNGEYRYAECNTHCTSIANWNIGSTGPSYIADEGRYFALDNQNRPRLVLYNFNPDYQGTWYRFCDADCTNLDNWWETQVTDEQLFRSALVFSSSGQPRFIAESIGGSSRELQYYACDVNCDNSNYWSFITLTSSEADSAYSFRLDHLNRPRLALYTGYSGLTDDFQLEYIWCDNSCLDSPNNWNGYILGFDDYYGRDLDLALDSQNRPHLAFYTDAEPYGLAYSTCTAGCESLDSVWNSQFIETADELNAIDPVPPEDPCSLSSWYPGQKPVLVLGSTNQLYFVYDAQHLQGGTCYAHTDINMLRVAMLDGAGKTYNVFLPLLKR